MRNILLPVAALAMLFFVGSAVAATPNTPEAPSVLVESASDMPSDVAAKTIATSTTMVNQPMEPPVINGGQPVAAQTQVVHRQQGHYQRPYRRAQPPKKQNFFEQLMELERKKNAWLKKTFLGR